MTGAPGAGMPSAPKLVAALFFAALAWFASDLIKAYLPEGTPAGAFSPVNAALGLVIGWRFAGPRFEAARDPARGPGVGLATVFVIAFWALIIWSGNEMVRKSMRGAYNGLFDALNSMMEIAIDQVLLIAHPDVIAVLVVGGLIGGWLGEWVAARR